MRIEIKEYWRKKRVGKKGKGSKKAKEIGNEKERGKVWEGEIKKSGKERAGKK